MIYESECKLTNGNNCPDASDFIAAFENQSSIIDLKFIDIDEDDCDWMNDESTAVITFNYEAVCYDERWANFVKLVHGLHCNEFDWGYSDDDTMVFRLWWD